VPPSTHGLEDLDLVAMHISLEQKNAAEVNEHVSEPIGDALE